MRPHVTVHRCPALAHKQLAAGGTVGGISVTTVGEAEVFADHGFHDIAVANEVVTPQKIRRLCALARRATLTVAVDNPANVRDLSEAAGTHGVTLQVAGGYSYASASLWYRAWPAGRRPGTHRAGGTAPRLCWSHDL